MMKSIHRWIMILVVVIFFPFFSQAGSFKHPGVLISQEQFDVIKRNLDKEPRTSALVSLRKNSMANLDYKPNAFKEVICGSGGDPNSSSIGCKEERGDAGTAYTQALLWKISGNKKYAENAKVILRAWTDTLEGHLGSNAPLQASWSGTLFSRAAEILNNGYENWTKEDNAKVFEMFKTKYIPSIKKMFSGSYRCYNQNWHATGIESLVNMSIFLEDKVMFDDAINKWKSVLPAYVYLREDGNTPNGNSWCPGIKKNWNDPIKYVDGLGQESCRDFEHLAYGLSAILNVAQTAKIQGVDLFNDKETKAKHRLIRAMELHSKYQLNAGTAPQLCKKYTGIKLSVVGTFEIGYTEYAVNQGYSMPETQKLLEKYRPLTGKFHYIWETLTYGSSFK